MRTRTAVTLTLATLVAAVALGAGGVLTRPAAEGGGAGAAGRLGFELRESKAELKLNYEVQAQDNGGGRASVTFTLADEGRIKPITQVKVAVPSADKSGYYDVVATLAPFERDGKKIYVLQLTRDLVERGELNLVTETMDGKRMMNWAYHRIPLGAALKESDKKKAAEKNEPEKKADGTPVPLPAADAPATPKPSR